MMWLCVYLNVSGPGKESKIEITFWLIWAISDMFLQPSGAHLGEGDGESVCVDISALMGAA